MSSQNGLSAERSMNGLISITGESIQATNIECDILETNTLIVNTNVDFAPSTTGDIYATNGTFDNLTANTFSFPFTPTELAVSTNLFSDDNITDITMVFTQGDNYQYPIGAGDNIDIITITVPSGVPPKVISWGMPTSYNTGYTKSSNGNIFFTYGYLQNALLNTRWRVYKNGTLFDEVVLTNDAGNIAQTITVNATGVSGFGSVADWYVFLGNIGGSFTTDYDATNSNTYVVELTWDSTTTFTFTGAGLNSDSQDLILNTTINYAYLVDPNGFFTITTYPTPLGIDLNKFLRADNIAQIGTTAVDNLITNEIVSAVMNDAGFSGIAPYTNTPTDIINMTGSLNVSNVIQSTSFYSSPIVYDYSYAYTSTLITTSTTNGNGTISRNNTTSRDTRVLLQTVNIPQYYQNTSFSFDYPLTLIASFTSTTTLIQNPTIVNTQTFSWTSASFEIYKNGALWQVQYLTAPTGSISTVVVSTSPQQPVNSVYSYSYTVYIGNAVGSFTPDFNYIATDDVYTTYLVPSMTFTNSQSDSTIGGSYTLGINNSVSTSSYSVSGANWVYNTSNYATGYSTNIFTENLFQLYSPTGTTIADELKSNNITSPTATITTLTNTTANINTGNITNVNSTTVNSDDINNTSTVSTKYVKFNYTSYPAYSNSQVLGYEDNVNLGSNVVLSNTTTRDVLSLTVPIGNWLITLRGLLLVNANFSQTYFSLGISATSATFNNNFRQSFTLLNSSIDFYFNHTFVFENTTQRTIYWVATAGNNSQVQSGADMIIIRHN